MLEMLKTANKAIGLKQTVKAVEADNAKVVFIADDADEKVVAGLRELCGKASVQVIAVESMKSLGKACGIEVGSAAAVILKG